MNPQAAAPRTTSQRRIQADKESYETHTATARPRRPRPRRRTSRLRRDPHVQRERRPRLHHHAGEEADEGGEDQARRVRQGFEPQLPPHRARRQREDGCRDDRHEDVHPHAQEGHVPVRLRSACELDEGLVQGLVGRGTTRATGSRQRGGPGDRPGLLRAVRGRASRRRRRGSRRSTRRRSSTPRARRGSRSR